MHSSASSTLAVIQTVQTVCRDVGWLTTVNDQTRQHPQDVSFKPLLVALKLHKLAENCILITLSIRLLQIDILVKRSINKLWSISNKMILEMSHLALSAVETWYTVADIVYWWHVSTSGAIMASTLHRTRIKLSTINSPISTSTDTPVRWRTVDWKALSWVLTWIRWRTYINGFWTWTIGPIFPQFSSRSFSLDR